MGTGRARETEVRRFVEEGARPAGSDCAPHTESIADGVAAVGAFRSLVAAVEDERLLRGCRMH